MTEIIHDIGAPRAAPGLLAGDAHVGVLRQILNILTRSPLATAGATILLFWALLALLAPWVAPYPPNKIDVMLVADPYPSAAHWLGVDHLGRDILSRLIWGARTVLTVAPIAVLGALALGVFLGLLSGYRGGMIDAVIMRIGDTLLAFPKIILYLIIIAKFGASAPVVDVLSFVLGQGGPGGAGSGLPGAAGATRNEYP